MCSVSLLLQIQIAKHLFRYSNKLNLSLNKINIRRYNILSNKSEKIAQYMLCFVYFPLKQLHVCPTVLAQNIIANHIESFELFFSSSIIKCKVNLTYFLLH